MAKTHPVSMDGFQFSPKDIPISVGDTVEWTNGEDDDWHSATHQPAEGAKELFDSPRLFAGDSYSFQFDVAGTYNYFCRNHPEHMKGTVVVSALNAEPKPADI
jgi:plastocyanin